MPGVSPRRTAHEDGDVARDLGSNLRFFGHTVAKYYVNGVVRHAPNAEDIALEYATSDGTKSALGLTPDHGADRTAARSRRELCTCVTVTGRR